MWKKIAPIGNFFFQYCFALADYRYATGNFLFDMKGVLPLGMSVWLPAVAMYREPTSGGLLRMPSPLHSQRVSLLLL